jgi:signal transduction histidine kinase/DNA-binding response OmpR family regulator
MPKPGKYPISVSCTKRNGKWTDPTYLMTLIVPRPWFLSWWFMGACLLFLALTYLTAIYSINRRKGQELKMAMKEQEQKVYEEKVNMLINISHELRTPLTLIKAPLKRLLKGMGEENESFPVLSRIYRQSRRMQNLLDMVLDLRKMEESGRHMKLEHLNFNSWITACVDDIVNEEKAEGINIVYDFDNAVGNAEFDRQKCDIVLMNILINAIKHSSAGDTITIKTSLTEYGMIRTSVSDQGPGLSVDIDLNRVFTRFYQSNNEKYGSGIGLSYSKILVEMHGGNIGVYNNMDMGATFWWEIPVAAISDEEIEGRAYLNELLGYSSEADSISPSEDTFNTSGMRLMIVDDNPDLLDFLRESLCNDFGEIVTATGGKAALREISSGKLPDIIVSDVNMPEGDGFWLCDELKKNEKYSYIPLVLLTARGEDKSQSESYRLGADGFLAKPFEVDTLLELLRGLLKRKADIRKKYLDNEDIPEGDYGSEEERFILQLNRIIADNLSNPALDQQLICRELGVSRALLYNRMKAITGAGAKEYITKIRIEKAKALIESTSLTIAEISDMTGFASQSYFSTAFKNYAGMTPSQYKMARKESKNIPSDGSEEK